MTAASDGLAHALTASASSARLDAAFAAGTRPDPSYVPVLVARCAVEPDFFVRDTLTWALTRHPAELTVPALTAEVASSNAQARSQALHTLTKVGDPSSWTLVTPALLHDEDDRVARATWRLAAQLVPPPFADGLALELASELGRGDTERRQSLSRAFAALGEVALPVLDRATATGDPLVRSHAAVSRRMIEQPDIGFDEAVLALEAEGGTV